MSDGATHVLLLLDIVTNVELVVLVLAFHCLKSKEKHVLCVTAVVVVDFFQVRTLLSLQDNFRTAMKVWLLHVDVTRHDLRAEREVELISRSIVDVLESLSTIKELDAERSIVTFCDDDSDLTLRCVMFWNERSEGVARTIELCPAVVLLVPVSNNRYKVSLGVRLPCGDLGNAVCASNINRCCNFFAFGVIPNLIGPKGLVSWEDRIPWVRGVS